MMRRYFYPRSPCGERHYYRRGEGVGLAFLSTLSLRRATSNCLTISPDSTLFLSTLSLRRATTHHFPALHNIFISIHALLAESDSQTVTKWASSAKFLSTLSLRRATANWFDLWGWAEYFYPRSPCGERPFEKPENVITTKISIHALLAESDGSHYSSSRPFQKFLSTLSLRRATFQLDVMITTFYYFYPRSPCGERLFQLDVMITTFYYFYPRSPCGERL